MYSQHGSPFDLTLCEPLRQTNQAALPINNARLSIKKLGISSFLRRVPYLPESNSNVIGRAQDNGRPELHVAIARISIDAFVFLQHSDDCVADFCECELLAYADARSAVEGEILCVGVSVSPPHNNDGYGMHNRQQCGDSISLAG